MAATEGATEGSVEQLSKSIENYEELKGFSETHIRDPMSAIARKMLQWINRIKKTAVSFWSLLFGNSSESDSALVKHVADMEKEYQR